MSLELCDAVLALPETIPRAKWFSEVNLRIQEVCDTKEIIQRACSAVCAPHLISVYLLSKITQDTASKTVFAGNAVEIERVVTTQYFFVTCFMYAT